MHSFVIALTLLATEQTGEEDTDSIDGEQRANRVELGGEDLEHDKRKRELADCRAHIGALKRALGRPNLNQLIACQYNGAGAMQMQSVSVFCVTALVYGQSRRFGSRLVCPHFEHSRLCRTHSTGKYGLWIWIWPLPVFVHGECRGQAVGDG